MNSKMNEMKMTIVTLALAALANSQAWAGTSHCKAVELHTGASAGIEVQIQWDDVKRGELDMPPYFVHQTQDAAVTISKAGTQATYLTQFARSGGTTRCEWWTASVAQIENVAKIVFEKSNPHSCRWDKKDSATLILSPDTASETQFELICN